jgi:tRNA dimethylallyltransferase
LGIDELRARLTSLDPEAVQHVDMKNRRRIVRAIEICLAGGRPLAAQRTQWKEKGKEGEKAGGDFPGGIGFQPMSSESSAGSRCHHPGFFVFRDREELYERINKRVEAMLKNGAIEEVRNAREISPTVEQMIGVKDIREYLADKLSLAECVTRVQQSTRQYAKRQLTWFRRQTMLESLNLSLLSHNEAVESILRRLSPGAQ